MEETLERGEVEKLVLLPTKEQVDTDCRIGQEADTCIWLMMDAVNGWECHYHTRPESLLKRWKDGLTSAKRDGCDRVRRMSFGNARN